MATAMGVETANGIWLDAYGVQIPLTIGGQQYFYGQNLSTRSFFI